MLVACLAASVATSKCRVLAVLPAAQHTQALPAGPSQRKLHDMGAVVRCSCRSVMNRQLSCGVLRSSWLLCSQHWQHAAHRWGPADTLTDRVLHSSRGQSCTLTMSSSLQNAPCRQRPVAPSSFSLAGCTATEIVLLYSKHTVAAYTDFRLDNATQHPCIRLPACKNAAELLACILATLPSCLFKCCLLAAGHLPRGSYC